MKLLTFLLAAQLAAGTPHGPDEDMPMAMPAPKVSPSPLAVAPPAPKASPSPLAVAPPAPAVPKPLGQAPKPVGQAPRPLAAQPVAPKPVPSQSVTPKAAPSAEAVTATSGKTSTPAGCRKLSTDVDWPADAEWKKVLPEIAPRSKTLAKGVYRPDYKVQAESYKDVQESVKFCAKNNLRLTLITTGHDFLGRNDAPSGLSLDTSLLQGIQVHEEFTPTTAGAAKPKKAFNTIVPVAGKQAAVTFGVGVTTQVLNNALHNSKLVSVGAAHGSVAPAGGYGQTSGHSPISSLYGLGADQFLEFKVVTADGELKVANKVSNPDLFWALRGGGGSTFGVVVQATMKAHPDIPITVLTSSVNTTVRNSDGLWDASAYLHTQFVDLVENHGVSAYYYIYPTRIAIVSLHQASGAGRAKAQKAWEPILKKMSSYPNMVNASFGINEYDTFKGYFDARFGAIDKPMAMTPAPTAPWEQTGKRLLARHGPGEEMKSPEPQAITNLDSRLLGAEHFKNPDLAKFLKASAPWASPMANLSASQAVIQGHLIGGKKVLHPDDDTSVLPAWRKAYSHVIGYNVPGKANVNSLRALAPDMGAYANEAYSRSEDWKTVFWGSNYAKLSAIKTKYDPDYLFWVSPGINADHMEARGGRVCKVSKIVESKVAPLSDNLNNGRLVGAINGM